jgi:hypothetical protein
MSRAVAAGVAAGDRRRSRNRGFRDAVQPTADRRHPLADHVRCLAADPCLPLKQPRSIHSELANLPHASYHSGTVRAGAARACASPRLGSRALSTASLLVVWRSHDVGADPGAERFSNRTDGATRVTPATRTCGSNKAGLDQPTPTVALVAKGRLWRPALPRRAVASVIADLVAALGRRRHPTPQLAAFSFARSDRPCSSPIADA